MDWSSLLSALIGAGAALVGVWFTQQSERRKARDERLWTSQSQAYLTAMKWAGEVEESLVAWYRAVDQVDTEIMDCSLLPELDTLTHDEWAAIALFAPTPVDTLADLLRKSVSRLNEFRVGGVWARADIRNSLSRTTKHRARLAHALKDHVGVHDSGQAVDLLLGEMGERLP